MSQSPVQAPGITVTGRKVGRPSKGRRTVVYTQLYPGTLSAVAMLANSAGAAKGETLAALTIIGITRRNELARVLAKLATVPDVVTEHGELQLAQTPNSSPETTLFRLPSRFEGVARDLAIEHNVSRPAILAALITIGLRYPSELRSAIDETHVTAMRPRRFQENQGVLDIAI